MELETEIVRILQDAAAQIQANMAAQGVNASGRTSASIHVREYDGGFQLVGGHEGDHTIDTVRGGSMVVRDTAPISTLEVGRQGGKIPNGFYHILRQWSKDKGINFDTERERSTFAYFLSKKIAREGTDRHTANIDVYTTPTEQAIERIKAAAAAEVSRQVRAAIGGLGFTAQINH